MTPAGLYLRTPATGVVALLAHDAVRLPCALVLPTTAAELPLNSVADGSGDAMLGDGRLAWTGPVGPVVVRSVREWAPAKVRRGHGRAAALAGLIAVSPAPGELRGCGSAVRTATPDSQRRPRNPCGIDGELLTLLTTRPAAAVAGLLGQGQGLTPAGDDVLAGFMLGARAFGLDASGVQAAIAVAPARTTALSAALLWHAARGECVDEVADVVADPCRATVDALLRVGHTSGPALATGLATAAFAALRSRTPGQAA